jgi:geranylgeranyl diphosphate synthase, type II
MPSASLLDLESKKKAIEDCLEALIPPIDHHLLFSAARYSLLGQGKRLRPLLVILSAESFGADVELAMYPACALEMIHTYSLIHDDLPCMDDDDLRRGRPTLHKVYPEGHAVLTGDFLLTYAFEVLCQSPGLTAEQKLLLVQSLSLGAGEKGMVGGQVDDIAWSRSNYQPSRSELEQMQIKKTSSLFMTALDLGAIVAGVDETDRKTLLQIGQTMGLAFQFADDLADGDGITLLLGPEETKRQVQSLFASGEQLMNHLSQPVPLLSQFFRHLLKNNLQ